MAIVITWLRNFVKAIRKICETLLNVSWLEVGDMFRCQPVINYISGLDIRIVFWTSPLTNGHREQTELQLTFVANVVLGLSNPDG